MGQCGCSGGTVLCGGSATHLGAVGAFPLRPSAAEFVFSVSGLACFPSLDVSEGETCEVYSSFEVVKDGVWMGVGVVAAGLDSLRTCMWGRRSPKRNV